MTSRSALRAVALALPTTPILFMDKGERQLLLQGTELGYAWALALNRTSGRFSAPLTDRDGAFVLFGSCTPL